MIACKLHLVAIIPAASTCNQKATAGNLQNIANPTQNQLLVIQALSNLPDSVAQHALNLISGEQYTTLLAAAELTGQQFVRRLYDPLRPMVTTLPCCNRACCPSTSDAWFEGGGGQTRLNGNINCHGIKMNSYDLAGGFQGTFNCDWTVGAAASYAHDHIQYHVGGKGNNRSTFAALYGLYRPRGYYVLGDVALGYTQDSVKRPIHIGDLSYKASSHPEIYQGLAYAEVGIDLCPWCFLLQPFAGLEVSVLRRSHIDDRGADILNLDINEKIRTNVHTRLGAHLSTKKLRCVTLSVDVAWLYRISSPNNNINQNFEKVDDKFKIYGNPIGRSGVDATFTAITNITDKFQLYAEASGQRWSRAYTYNFLAGAMYSW